MADPISQIMLGDHAVVVTWAPGTNPDTPGLYRWTVEGAGIYIGQYTRSSRPLKHYGRNIVRMRDGKDYRKSKPTKFRPIHRELAKAIAEGRQVTLEIIESHADKAARNARERELIQASGSLNSPPFGRRTAKTLT
jgi:hypothetical protein